MKTVLGGALGNPNTAGEWPYDSSEHFTEDEYAEALRLRTTVTSASDLRRRDDCPHTPPCPNVRICLEEIAWYLRHRVELHARLESL